MPAQKAATGRLAGKTTDPTPAVLILKIAVD
jgi:hypothetical protein